MAGDVTEGPLDEGTSAKADGTAQVDEDLMALLSPLANLGASSAGTSFDKTPDTADTFLKRSYTLRLNGQIIDRGTRESLEDVNPDAAKSVAERLLQVIPRGGRLRVTASGGVARYQDEQWAVVEKVSKSEWFPGHLT